MDLQGFCRISQSDMSLTEHAGKAVTTVAPGDQISWRLTYHPSVPDSRQLTIALSSGPLAESSSVVHVLTVGKKTEEEAIQIFLEPVQDPPSKSQLWTLENVMPTKR